jgi:hypothetical protein
MPAQDAEKAGSGDQIFAVSNRTIMTYSTAKRLRNSLDTLIKRYEERFGEISLQPKTKT